MKSKMGRTTLLAVGLLCFIVVASAGNGNVSTKNNRNAIAEGTRGNKDKTSSTVCRRTALCCKLGRKAVRLEYTASVHTCKIEALVQGLKHHKSASHRLRKPNNAQADRMDAANSLRMSYGFRWRLKLCESQGPVQRQCFQYCCEHRLREKQAKAKMAALTQNQKREKTGRT